MDYKRLRGVKKGFRGFKGVTVRRRVFKRIERVTAGYNGFLGLQGVPRG